MTDPEMDDALRSVFREMRERKGPCPDSAALADYLSGQLAPGDAETVRRHIEYCGECDCMVERMRAFDGAALAPPEWKAAEGRLRARLGFRQPSAGLLERLGGWRVVFAYALVLGLLYPAYRGVFAPPGKEMPSQPTSLTIEPARSFDLSQVRGGATEIRLAEGEDTFILTFFIPVRVGYDYFASVAGVRTRLGAADSAGSLYLVCNRQLFPVGEYRLTVTEMNPQTGQAREFPAFQFTVR